MGCAGGRLKRKPLTVNVSPSKTTRSPRNAWRRKSRVSRTRVAGRAKRPPFQNFTIGCDPAPMPRQKRPGANSAMPAALIAKVAGPRVYTLAIAEPSRSPVVCANAASGAKQSTPSTSIDHASV